MEDFLKYVVPALLGLGGGVVGSLVAPWVQWAVEKRKRLNESRREFLKECREQLDPNVKRYEFLTGKLYGRLKPFLSEFARKLIEAGGTCVVVTPGGIQIDPYLTVVMDELARLEKEWALI